MPLRLSIKSNLKKFREQLEKYPDQLRDAVVRGLESGAAAIERAAKLELTRNQSVAFGVLRASITHVVDPKTLRAVIGPGLQNKATAAATGDPRNYGFFVEFGRRPGRRPPVRVLSLWVKRRLGEKDPDDNRRLSFLIARKIGKRGTQAEPFLGPAAEREGPNVLKRIEREMDKTISDLNQQG